MVAHLVLLNGLPGSGKSTLGAELARGLGAVMISKDAIKEAVAAAVPGVPTKTLGSAAADMMWDLAAGVPGVALLESWWFKPRDLAFVRKGLQRCGDPTTVEIWCDVPAALARDRYAARRRHSLHDDERRLADSWTAWADKAEPLGVGETIWVRTDRPVDLEGVAAHVTALLSRADGADTSGSRRTAG